MDPNPHYWATPGGEDGDLEFLGHTQQGNEISLQFQLSVDAGPVRAVCICVPAGTTFVGATTIPGTGNVPTWYDDWGLGYLWCDTDGARFELNGLDGTAEAGDVSDVMVVTLSGLSPPESWMDYAVETDEMYARAFGAILSIAEDPPPPPPVPSLVASGLALLAAALGAAGLSISRRR
jgi:hypothetical protein